MAATNPPMDASMTPRERRHAIPSQVLGTMIFVLTEIMMFAGLLSALNIVKEGSPEWPPANQPLLPAQTTGVFSAFLLLSGILLFVAWRRYAGGAERARLPFALAIAAGTVFVVGQGYEWAGLLRMGLTLQSSTLGSFFYLIVGTHALHVVCALAALVSCFRWLLDGTLTRGGFQAIVLFWSFVVLVWPFLYWQVYL